MPAALSPRHVANARAASRAASVILALAGAIVLAGWWLNLPLLQSVVPGATAMKANTAVGFILAGLALWLLQAPAPHPRLAAVRRVCAGLIALIGLLTLSEIAFGWQLGIDQLLVRDTSSTAGAFPGRAAVLTEVCFVLLGLAFFFLDA